MSNLTDFEICLCVIRNIQAELGRGRGKQGEATQSLLCAGREEDGEGERGDDEARRAGRVEGQDGGRHGTTGKKTLCLHLAARCRATTDAPGAASSWRVSLEGLSLEEMSLDESSLEGVSLEGLERMSLQGLEGVSLEGLEGVSLEGLERVRLKGLEGGSLEV